ncbi:TonB-dependent receptor [Bacterioplanes sanyensis]|uniref:TonB-dependent receptor plug domain-containing protein n=1 Tax=Bacterioplanes sanyensis TaxID=1249553 RepID=UPI001672DFCC|nr:TonB-dependent receptor [Bacterioplanes sanyensis]GGY47420.1 TonB-dependent receptor [Bacterioplanes sanyensis]
MPSSRLSVHQLLSCLCLPVLGAATHVTAKEPGHADLETVTVTSGSAPETSIDVADTGFNLSAIDTAEFFNFSKDLQQILNSSPGIIVRQRGALGSDSELSINGLSGNQVRYFLDGIPMEAFGSALRIGDLPVNVAERLDVYKGVVPISLSADALGGAVNIITPAGNEDYFNGAASYGSFNTLRSSFNSQHSHSKSGAFARLSGFFNHSDNDYEIDNAPVTDELGNVQQSGSVRRFHDAYRSHMLSAKLGLGHRTWADELSLGLTSAVNRNELQHPTTTVNQVYGQYHSTNRTWLSTLVYKFSGDDFALTSYLLKGQVDESYVDTASRRYQWDGSYTPRSEQLGEVGNRSRLTVSDDLLRANFSGRYHLTDQFSLGSALSFNRTDRSGDDSLQPDSTLLAGTNQLTKSVFALDSSQTFFDERLRSTVFWKHYVYEGEVSSVRTESFNQRFVTSKETGSANGFGLALQYQPWDSTTVKFSREKAYRIAEPNEMLGNGQFVLPNPELEPEQSTNTNLSANYGAMLNAWYLGAEINAFHRDASHFIYYNPSEVIRGRYENLGEVLAKGLELSTTVDYQDSYSAHVNMTYQDITDQTPQDFDGSENLHRGDRIPNTPYFFANARLGWTHHRDNFDKISIYATSRFVNEYYLRWESDGDKDQKDKIPSQTSYDLELEYVLSNIDMSASLTVSNLTDEALYDNFKIQKPGRAYYVKVRFAY